MVNHVCIEFVKDQPVGFWRSDDADLPADAQPGYALIYGDEDEVREYSNLANLKAKIIVNRKNTYPPHWRLLIKS